MPLELAKAEKLARRIRDELGLFCEHIEVAGSIRRFRTFGMICPSLPMALDRYAHFAGYAAEALRAERCEHVWAEVINARGASFTRTVEALRGYGLHDEAARLGEVMGDRAAWETHARATFEAHARAYAGRTGPDGTPQLRFMQYPGAGTRPWWEAQRERGAVVL